MALRQKRTQGKFDDEFREHVYELLRRVLPLGISYPIIARVIKMSREAIYNYVGDLGGREQFEPLPGVERFPAVLQRIAAIDGLPGKRVKLTWVYADSVAEDERRTLSTWIREKEIFANLSGMLSCASKILTPQVFEPAHEPYLIFINNLVGISHFPLEKAENIWQQYLADVRSGVRMPPKTRNELLEGLSSWIANAVRGRPGLILVPELIQLLDNLLDDIARKHPIDIAMLRLYYGLCGEPPKTFATVGQSFNVTRERVRHRVLRGMRRVRTAMSRRERGGVIAFINADIPLSWLFRPDQLIGGAPQCGLQSVCSA